MQKTKKKPLFEDEGLEAARDIFGCDFDYGEFEQYEGKFTLIVVEMEQFDIVCK